MRQKPKKREYKIEQRKAYQAKSQKRFLIAHGKS